jgi:hypothetical protein
MLCLGAPEAQARATSFVALVAANFDLVVVNRSHAASVVMALRRSNRAFWRMLAVTAALLTAALAVPPIRELFHFAPLEIGGMATAVVVGIAVLGALEAIKGWRLWRRRAIPD